MLPYIHVLFGNQNILYLCCLCFSLQPSLISFTISFSASRSTRSRHNISVDTLSLDCPLKHLSCANIGCICRQSCSTALSTSESSSTRQNCRLHFSPYTAAVASAYMISQ